jgi:TPR repeat protein
MSQYRALVVLAWAMAAVVARAAEADPGESPMAVPRTPQQAPVLLPTAPAEPELPPGLHTPRAPELSPQPPARPSIAPENARPPPVARPPEVDPALQAELARLRAAAARNGPLAGRAAWQLGLAALHGVGGPVDPAQARSWFTRAQRLGEAMSAAGLAWCAIDGCGGPADPAAARRWIAALRPLDAARAQYLDWLLASERAPLSVAPGPLLPGPQGAPTSRPAGPRGPPLRDQLEAAARAGSAQAQLELGLAAAAERRDDEALALFRAAAPRSRAAAANVALLGQRGAAPAAPGAGQATFERAQRVHRGIGQPANFTEAVRLYRQAHQEGSAPAARMLALIFSRPLPDGGVDIAWMQQLAQVDVTREMPTVDPSAARGVLRREPTPLSDLLPERWRPPSAR